MPGRVATWRSPQLCWVGKRGRGSIKNAQTDFSPGLVGYIRYEHFRALVKWDCILWSPHQSWCYSPHVMSHTYPRASIWEAKTPLISIVIHSQHSLQVGEVLRMKASLYTFFYPSSISAAALLSQNVVAEVYAELFGTIAGDLRNSETLLRIAKRGAIDFISINYCFQNLRVDLSCCLTWFRITLGTPFWVFLRG